MTARPVVQAFLKAVTEHPDVGAEFLRARDLWHTAVDAHSKELAEAAGEAFAGLCDLYGEARGSRVEPAERSVIRKMVQSERTPREKAN